MRPKRLSKCGFCISWRSPWVTALVAQETLCDRARSTVLYKMGEGLSVSRTSPWTDAGLQDNATTRRIRHKVTVVSG